MGKLAAILATSAIIWAGAAAAQSVEGAYALQGIDSKKTTYGGTVEVLKKGAGYQVAWTIDGEKTYGAGLMEGEAFVIGSIDEKRAIVQIMKRDGANLKGVWYKREDTGLGEETWIKK